MSYYEILEIAPNASPEVIRMAYKALAKKYHPDIYPGNKIVAERKMKQINEAYSVLSDPDQRKRYDRTLGRQESAHKQSPGEDPFDFADVNEDFTEQPTSSRSPKTHNHAEASENSTFNSKDDKLPIYLLWPVIIFLFFIDVTFTKWLAALLALARIGHNTDHPQHKLGKPMRNLLIVILVIFCIGAYTSSENAPKVEGENTIIAENDTDSAEVTEDSENNTNSSPYNLLVTDPEYIEWYAEEVGIKLHHWNRLKLFLKKLEKLTDDMTGDDLILLSYEKGGLFEKPYYKQSLYNVEYGYIGDIKDNKPHGIGMLVDSNGWLLYCGEFVDGRYSGFGMQFMVPFLESEIQNLIDKYGPDAINTHSSRINTIQYIGEFEDNERHGKGNLFVFPPVSTELDPNLYEESRHIDITVGEFDKGELYGRYKVYEDGYLHLDANIEKYLLVRKGKVTQYFAQSEQIRYEGETKNGKAHGKGTLYDEYGNVIYSGNWKDGNYA